MGWASTRKVRILRMGVLRGCLSDAVPQFEVARLLVSDWPSAANTRCTEWAIVQKAIAGDTEAQERLFARHRPKLYRIAVALLRNKDDMLDSYSAPPSCVGPDSQSNPETDCSKRQLNDLLDKQLLQLRPSLNVAFRLCAIHGFSLRESSQALGISVSAVKARLFWARRMLARGLRDL